MLRVTRFNELAHDGFGLFIGLCHGRAVVLVVNLDATQKSC